MGLDGENMAENNFKAYFENQENLAYRIATEKFGNSTLTFIVNKKDKIDLRAIPNFFNLGKPDFIKEIPDTNFYCLNGHNLRINASYQKTRFKNGYWLEMAIQLSLRKAKIDFLGNSPNLAHYPHSLGLDVDLETDYLLIEATNLTKWLNFDGFQEKINYFLKHDLNHKKKWVIVTTYQKAIPKLIRQQILNHNITLILINQVANPHNINQIANQLIQPLTELTRATKENQLNQLILTVKNRYLDYSIINQTPEVKGCRSNNLENKSGLAG
jgi:hypothetical protein